MKGFKQISLSLLSISLLCAACGGQPQTKNAGADGYGPGRLAGEKGNKRAAAGRKTTYLKDETTAVLLDNDSFKKEDVVKVVKHGDHWHVFTKDGKEHITYKDPAKLSADEELEMVNVVSLDQLKGKAVSSIKVHGDHWHVFTREGQEFLTYEDPSALFSNIKVEQYTGSHGNKRSGHKAGLAAGRANGVGAETVIRILQHGDHYHIYTDRGNEYISYTDPRSRYPRAVFGQYQGGHGGDQGEVAGGPEQGSGNRPQNNRKNGKSTKPGQMGSAQTGAVTRRQAIQALHIIGILSGGQLDRFDVVKILQHGDHFHLYDSKGHEGITRTNPQHLYPQASFGQYQGSHGDRQGGRPKPSQPSEPDQPAKPDRPSGGVKWPAGVSRIVGHGDHWHLYRGDEEIGIVKEDPRPHYPKAEYIDESKPKYDGIDIPEAELFSYDSVEPELYEGVIPYLGDLKNMTDFGSLTDTALPVYGTEGRENIFYWLHGNHYHAMSLKQVIRNAMAGEYGPYTARQVVATVKYKMVNGGDLEEEVDALHIDAVKSFLKKVYQAADSEIWTIGNLIYVEKGGETYTFNGLTDFTVKEGQVTPKNPLPGL